VTLLTKLLEISFGEMLTTKVFIGLVGKKIARPKYQGGLGIRTSRENNICLLGKLVWDMLQSSNKLWVDLLSDKYHDNARLLYAPAWPSDSSTWSAIIHAKIVSNLVSRGAHG
jgi:hypothetical protein